MDIKVINNGWEIIGSGYLIVSESETVDFIVGGLLFQLSFKTVAGGDSRVGIVLKKDSNGKDYMSIECENFDNSMLRTTNDPLLLAKKDGRNIALHLTTSSIIPNQRQDDQVNVENKVLFYCWMMELPKNEKQRG